MECDKIFENEKGELITTPKRKFSTIDEATIVAEYENSKFDRTYKVVTYKCKICYKYHIGRDGNKINDKERDNSSKKISSNKILKDKLWKSGIKNIKVVGFIDLSKISKK